MKRIFWEVCTTYDQSWHSIEGMLEHCHLLIQADHTTAPVAQFSKSPSPIPSACRGCSRPKGLGWERDLGYSLFAVGWVLGKVARHAING